MARRSARDRGQYLDAMGVQLWRLREAAPAPASGVRADQGMPAPAADGATPPTPPSSGPERRYSGLGPGGSFPGSDAPVDEGADDAASPGDGVEGNDRPAVGHPETPLDVARMDWDQLRDRVRECRDCGLCEMRTQTVFGVGAREADLMIVGEAPGADEDRQGEPFVGRAGQLLNLMLASIGLARQQVYIANVLKCRPPGNRDPRPDESAACRAFLMRQIELVRPRVILSVGRVSAQHLLDTDEAVGRLRGRWFEFGPAQVALTVTYHPSYLLRSPEQKARAWQDLLKVAHKLREA